MLGPRRGMATSKSRGCCDSTSKIEAWPSRLSFRPRRPRRVARRPSARAAASARSSTRLAFRRCERGGAEVAEAADAGWECRRGSWDALRAATVPQGPHQHRGEIVAIGATYAARRLHTVHRTAHGPHRRRARDGEAARARHREPSRHRARGLREEARVRVPPRRPAWPLWARAPLPPFAGPAAWTWATSGVRRS